MPPARASSRWCAGLKLSKILTRQAFENAIVCASALGASTNCPPHVNAIARHAGVELTNEDWDRIGYHIPLLVNMMPAGEYLGEEYYRAGGLPAVFGELLRARFARIRSLSREGRLARITAEPEVWMKK